MAKSTVERLQEELKAAKIKAVTKLQAKYDKTYLAQDKNAEAQRKLIQQEQEISDALEAIEEEAKTLGVTLTIAPLPEPEEA